jgi:hypothetical protein
MESQKGTLSTMFTVQKEYEIYVRILSKLFENMEPVNNTLRRFVNLKDGKVPEMAHRLRGLLKRCGNLNAVKEFIVHLVFEIYYIENGDISYFLPVLGDGKFHFITLGDVVEHINEKERLIVELNRKLDKGEIIAIHTDNIMMQKIVRFVKKSFLMLTFRNPKRYEFS